ncbi:hypothetical protein OSB04_010989 [Centaurea solstitialis]|uniref:Uncharacterized protein n=1 Tax=Centaurea solstitialis TaxID=347529 RepID=A0AA38TKB9_9ASTR|nr:hypothetical protein OSB04_010989 [Centaurea solstitialis]
MDCPLPPPADQPLAVNGEANHHGHRPIKRRQQLWRPITTTSTKTTRSSSGCPWIPATTNDGGLSPPPVVDAPQNHSNGGGRGFYHYHRRPGPKQPRNRRRDLPPPSPTKRTGNGGGGVTTTTFRCQQQPHSSGLALAARPPLLKRDHKTLPAIAGVENHQAIGRSPPAKTDGCRDRDFDQKRIFLDIACSFIGRKKDFLASVLDSDDCFIDANIEVLVDKSLITVSPFDNLLQMHELIRSMAREIVREESNWPGHRSRLWTLSDVHNVLKENKATEAVEILDLLEEETSQKVLIDGKVFAHMKNLRILKICHKELGNVWHGFDLKLWNDFKVNYSGRLEFLSNRLRLLYWHGCGFNMFPSDFYPENIVAIDLSYSQIKYLWTTPKCFRKLKVMKLKHCRNLTTTPDFTRITNLEELVLEGCVNLVKFHPSFGVLKKLIVLNMKDCILFRGFPSKVEMDSLQVMNLSGCSKVDRLPEFFDTIQTLKEFCVDGTAIAELPSLVFSQHNLQVLQIGGHERNQSRRWLASISQPSWFPSRMQHPKSMVMPSLAGLRFLRELIFSDCNISEVSDSIGGLSCLKELTLSGNNFTSLPECLSQLPSLYFLHLFDCKKLVELPELPPTLQYLVANNCASLQELHGLLDHDQPQVYVNFIGCPKLFTNHTFESQLSVSQPQPINSSTTSLSSRNRFLSFLRHMNFPSDRINGIFRTQERDFWYVDLKFHGNRIPQWYSNRSVGNRVKIDLPRDWCYEKFRGYGICVVFTSKKSCNSVDDYKIPMYFVSFDGDSSLDPHPYRSENDSTRVHESDIIWFHFTKENPIWMKAKNFASFSFGDSDDVEVKECGVRLVFDEDIEGETDLSIIQDLPTPTQDGGVFCVQIAIPMFNGGKAISSPTLPTRGEQKWVPG